MCISSVKMSLPVVGYFRILKVCLCYQEGEGAANRIVREFAQFMENRHPVFCLRTEDPTNHIWTEPSRQWDYKALSAILPPVLQ